MAEKNNCLAYDSASVRTVDENGFMHVACNHITKAKVDLYHGNEVPGWQSRGLDPNKIYYGLRDPEELQKSLHTWAGLPLHLRHHDDSAADPQKLTRVGTVGTEVVWNAPYVDAPLTIWDQVAIDAINNGTCKELSCAYQYDPDWTPGQYEGLNYDFVMRNIRGNHVALVEVGRAGPDVVVADHKTVNQGDPMDKKTIAKDGDPEIEQKEVDLAQAIIDLHKVDPTTGKIVDIMEDEDKAKAVRDIVGELAGKVDPELLKRLQGALSSMAFKAPVPVPEEDDAKPADDTPAPAPAPAPDANPFKEAMDACGLDSSDEGLSKAFAAGVKHAQGQKEEPAAAPAAEGEDSKDCTDVKGASDAKPALRKEKVVTMDADTIKAQAVQETRKQMQELFAAVERVRPLTGSLKAMTFDSADDVYKHALQSKGIDPAKYEPAAWRGMVDMLLREPVTRTTPIVQDAKPDDFTGAFEHLQNMIV